MRARVLVGEISSRSIGATRSGIDRKFELRQRVVGRAVALAGLEVEQPLGIDGDGARFRGRGGGDGAGDDVGLHQQALRAGVDQAGAELRQVENAGDERDQAGEVEEQDAPRQARKARWRRNSARRRGSGRACRRQAARCLRTARPRRRRHPAARHRRRFPRSGPASVTKSTSAGRAQCAGRRSRHFRA